MKRLLENYQGIDYYLYEIKKGPFRLTISEYGATICNFEYQGIDLVQGFENVHSYVEEVKYMNAVIGRVCNRIALGQYHLNGQTYQLYVNNGPNCLHGGKEGFDAKKWNLDIVGDSIVCHYISKDQEEGFNGNVDIYLVYTLLEDGLRFAYSATSDEDTPLSICNHAFFNINGLSSKSILEDELLINANKIAKVDADGLSLEETLDVEGTPFDFRQFKKIGQDINANHPQIQNAQGYDHHFIIEGEGLRHFATYQNNYLMMEVYSDLPGMHLYSANYLAGNYHGKDSNNYPRRSSICFETQYYPNAINMKEPLKPILKKNEIMYHETQFIIKEKENAN